MSLAVKCLKIDNVVKKLFNFYVCSIEIAKIFI